MILWNGLEAHRTLVGLICFFMLPLTASVTLTIVSITYGLELLGTISFDDIRTPLNVTSQP